jgi:transposase
MNAADTFLTRLRQVGGLRRILDAIFYVVPTGCAWRSLPGNFPAWQTAFYHIRRFRPRGIWHLLYTGLHRAERTRLGRHPDPSAAIMDSQSAKTVEESACICGYDGHRCSRGRKRHLLVDALGLPGKHLRAHRRWLVCHAARAVPQHVVMRRIRRQPATLRRRTWTQHGTLTVLQRQSRCRSECHGSGPSLRAYVSMGDERLHPQRSAGRLDPHRHQRLGNHIIRPHAPQLRLPSQVERGAQRGEDRCHPPVTEFHREDACAVKWGTSASSSTAMNSRQLLAISAVPFCARKGRTIMVHPAYSREPSSHSALACSRIVPNTIPYIYLLSL